MFRYINQNWTIPGWWLYKETVVSPLCLFHRNVSPTTAVFSSWPCFFFPGEAHAGNRAGNSSRACSCSPCCGQPQSAVVCLHNSVWGGDLQPAGTGTGTLSGWLGRVHHSAPSCGHTLSPSFPLHTSTPLFFLTSSTVSSFVCMQRPIGTVLSSVVPVFIVEIGCRYGFISAVQ